MSDTITYSEAKSEIRKIARKSGMTFKTTNLYKDGKRIYKFVRRFTGDDFKNNEFTFWSSYDNAMNGFIDTLNY